jgi:uncharacterized ion transporter superfamily protein YfcC
MVAGFTGKNHMNKKLTTMVAAFVLLPVCIVIGIFIAGAFIPVGTFNAAEKRHVEIRTESLKAIGLRPATAEVETITAVNSAGTIRVNNLA